jgi:MATE family multidrug resistance protein
MDAALSADRPSPWIALRRTRPILVLGAPLLGFYLVPSAVSIAAVAAFGRVGAAAVAGVGVGSAIYTAVCALLWGVDTGVQAIVARVTGAERADRIAGVLAAAYAGVVPLAIGVGAAVWTFGPRLVALILPDHAAAAAGGAWIAAAAPSVIFLAVTLPINAVWIGGGRPGIAMAVTAFSAPLQIALTWALVLGAGPIPAFGAVGGSLAMDATMLAAVFVQIALALRSVPGFLRVSPLPGALAEILRIGWPISVQQSLLQVALMAIFAVVARLGAQPVAIVNVLLTLTSAPTLIATAAGVAAATLVGQALGRGDAGGARSWGWRATALTIATTAPAGLALTLAPRALMALFLHDPATLAAAILPARIVGFGVAVNAAAVVLGFAFRGAGATKLAAAVPFVSLWCLQLPLMAWIGVVLRQGLAGVVLVQTAVVSGDAVVLALLWTGSSWTRVWIGAAAASSPLPATLRRIAILGGGGAGKSTLARRLGEALGLPVVHLDRLVYGPGWTYRNIDVARAELAEALEFGSWIVEGTYPWASELTLPNADVVLWLDQPVWRRLFRAWRKTRLHWRRPRADRPGGCEERFGWTYARLVLAFGAWTPGVAAGLATTAGDRLRRLRGDAEVRRLLAEIAKR